MEARLLRRPLGDLLSSRIQYTFSANVNALACRHVSSYRRTKQRLNIKPDSTFLLNSQSPQQDHIIFNPPSSAPNVLHTPAKFLPKDDRRKQLFAAKTATQTPRLPPVIPKFKPVGVRHHLTDVDIAEIRKLRLKDPEVNTARKLAIKFNCSTYFISMVCEAPKEKKQRDEEAQLAKIARYGPKRTKAREDRKRRMELALRDE